MKPFSTTITAVTVYPDRARITRTGTAALDAGNNQLIIEELPMRMIPESLRTAAHGTVRARLLGAQVQKKHYVETPSETIRQLEEQIEALQEELNKLDIQSELLKGQRETLDKIAGQSDKFALALASGEMQVEQELAIFDALRIQGEKLETEALGLQRTRKQIDQRLQKLLKDLEQLRSSRPRERYAAIVEVEMRQAGELTLELSYVVHKAEWQPIYDLRLVEEENNTQCDVTYLAQVTQNTGENWDGVRLTLSTARPAQSQGLPELKPWYVQPPTIAPRAVMAAPMMAAPDKRMKAMSMAERVEEDALLATDFEAQAVMAEVDTTGTAVTYAIPGTVSIPPDGTAHKVTVARFPLPPRLDYICVPRLTEAVYRRAKVKNDSPYTLLPGQVSLFVGDEFIGTTPLELTAPQGEIELALGIEDRIKVERELKRRDVDKRLISGRRHQVYGYEIRLENLLPAIANTQVQDQIPVAKHEDVKVKLETCQPKPSEQSELNILKWDLSLESKEKRTFRFDFSVDSPQGMDLIGLP